MPGPLPTCARWRAALRLYDFLTSGRSIRFVPETLQRRIIFANTIGLAILLGGIFYLSQYHAWLIDAKRESLRAQGEIIAAAIAANASVETGRIVLDPDRLPEIEGSRSPFRDDGFAALQLSIAPERVTPILRRLVPTRDTRARVYAQDGTLIVDTAQLLSRGQLVASGAAGRRQPGPRQGQEHLDALPGLADARRSAGLSRDRPGQRHRLSRGAHGARRLDARRMLLVNEKGEQIVSLAVPIQYRKAVQGVLLLSTRPGEIDEVLSEERNVIIGAGAHRVRRDAARLVPARPHHRRPHAPALGGGRERQPQHQGAPRAARACAAAPTRSARWPPPSAR